MSRWMTAIIPKDFINPDQCIEAVEAGLDVGAEGVQKDFLKTTQGWKDEPDFTIQKEKFRRIIGTNSKVYGYVNAGTKPHIIAPRNKKALSFMAGGSAKTTPRVIGSGAGSRGTTRIIRRKPVRHPGTTAREFDVTIAELWDGGPLRDAVQAELDKAVKR